MTCCTLQHILDTAIYNISLAAWEQLPNAGSVKMAFSQVVVVVRAGFVKLHLHKLAKPEAVRNFAS